MAKLNGKVWLIGKYRVDEKDINRAISNGLNRRTVADRLTKCNHTLEEALTLPLGHRKSPLFTDEQLQQAKENGIRRNTLYSRVYELDWSTERACTEPIDIKRRRKGART